MFFGCIAETGIRFRKYKTSLLPESHSLNSFINSTLICIGQVCEQVCVWGCLVNWWPPCRADSKHNFLFSPRSAFTFISQFFEGDSKWMLLNLSYLSLSMISSATLMRGLLLNGCRTTGKNCLWIRISSEYACHLCLEVQYKFVFWCSMLSLSGKSRFCLVLCM